MCSARDNAALPTLGFPIRASAGHWPFSASPRLIAAVHALHRLLVPRHPPCALTILTGDRGIARRRFHWELAWRQTSRVMETRSETRHSHSHYEDSVIFAGPALERRPVRTHI